jgi:hypothetical protein
MPLCLLLTPAHALRPRTVPTASQEAPDAPAGFLRASPTRAEARAATLQAAGVTSLNGIAKALNAPGRRHAGR